MFSVKVVDHFFKDMFSVYRHVAILKNDMVFTEFRIRIETVPTIKSIIEQMPKMLTRSGTRTTDTSLKSKLKVPFTWIPVRASDAMLNEPEAMINILYKERVLASFVHLSIGEARMLSEVLNAICAEMIKDEVSANVKEASPPAWNKRPVRGVTFI